MFDVQKSAGPEQVNPYPLPTLSVESLKFVKPSTKSTTVITEIDGVKQAAEEPTVEKTPFSAVFDVSRSAPQELIKSLGITRTPSGPIEISLYEKNGKLQARIESSYSSWETRNRQVPSGTEQVAWKGMESYPYGPKADRDEWKTTYTTESYEVAVTKAEITDKELSDKALGVVYASLYNASAENQTARELLGYLDNEYPDAIASARNWMEEQVQLVLAQRQAEQIQLKDFSFSRSAE